MRIKIRKENQDGVVRLESGGQIKEVMINEDIFHPEQESIALGFRGKHSSGLIELSTAEVEQLYEQVKRRLHLIKGLKVMQR